MLAHDCRYRSFDISFAIQPPEMMIWFDDMEAYKTTTKMNTKYA